MAKILFSDLDGTLIGHGGVLSEKNLEVMKQMQAQGHLIALCTGRNPVDVLPVTNTYKMPHDYLVLCNGSYIADNQGNILFEEHVSKETGDALIEYASKNSELSMMFCSDDGCLILSEGKTKVLGVHGLEDTDEDFHEFLKRSKRYYMLSVNFNDQSIEKVKQFEKEVNQMFPDLETHLNQHYLDIGPRGHSKGTGLKRLSQMIDVDKTYAIGDSYNDLSMFKEADVSVTFDYANEDIQKQVDKVVKFVYELIEEEILS